MNNFKALMTALVLAAAPLAFGQDTIPNISGAYQTKDKTSSGERLTLILTDGTSLGRPGSYFALLIDNNLHHVNGYFVDPTGSSKVMGMTPVMVSKDGEVGIGDVKTALDENSYNPSLRIIFGGQQQNGQYTLSVAPAGKNNKGWVGQATFDKKADIEWLPLQVSAKPYQGRKNCKITITDFDSDGNAQISADKCNEISAPSYQVREKLPTKTYSLKSDVLTNHDTELPTMPNQLAFFVKKDGKRYLLLTSTEFGQVQQKIELKN